MRWLKFYLHPPAQRKKGGQVTTAGKGKGKASGKAGGKLSTNANMGKGKKRVGKKIRKTKEDLFTLVDEDEPIVGGVVIRDVTISRGLVNLVVSSSESDVEADDHQGTEHRGGDDSFNVL